MVKPVNMNATAPDDNDGEPLGCFQVLAERKYMPSVKGYQNFRRAFDSLAMAKVYGEAMASNTDYYTGYEWVQIADVFHGRVWDFEDGQWIASQAGAQ